MNKESDLTLQILMKRLDNLEDKVGGKALPLNKIVNEEQTISYQLGKMQIDAFKSWDGLKILPKGLWQLHLEAVARQERKGKKLSHLESILLKHFYKEVHNDEQGVSDVVFEEFKNTTSIAVPAERNLLYKEVGQTLKIAAIMDEFTYLSFSSEANVLQLTPNNWLEEVQDFNPDFLFIESAWQGKESLWKSKISSFSSEVQELIHYCRESNIPSMLWNKEDPVHFGTFIELAKNVDTIFTTDIDCIQKYKKNVGHDNVYLLPFAAQTKIHNPIELYERKDKFNFAGSFYLKYPERQRDFLTLAQVAKEYKGLDIYDRNHDKPHPHYTFPEQFKPLILGSLPASEIDKAYKGYRFGINMNTIKQSQSMFARRVFEMLASNTIVLSNYSRGVRNLFGDLVVCSDHPDELSRQLSLIMQTEMSIEKFRLQGLRKVLSQHTYAHRLDYISSKLNIGTKTTERNIAVIASISSNEQYERIIEMFESQTLSKKNLFIFKLSDDLKECGTYQSFSSLQDLLLALRNSDFSHFAYWDCDAYYGPNYLLDMDLSFSYLQHFDVDIVTKERCYSLLTDGSVSMSGNEYKYKFVNQARIDRSLASVKHLACLADYLQKGNKTIHIKSLSIDEFNYLENYYVYKHLSNDLNIYLNDNTHVKDLGINLSELLSYTESIKNDLLPKQLEISSIFANPPKYKGLSVDFGKDILRVTSDFEPKSHRYVSSININVDGFNTFSLKGNVHLTSKATIIFDFYDIQNRQISITELKHTSELEGIIPASAKSMKIHLRSQGKSSLVLENVYLLLNVVSKKDGVVALQNSKDVLSFEAKTLYDLIIKPKSSAIKIDFVKNSIQVKSVLPEGKHAYFYLNKSFSRDELNLVLNSQVEWHSQQNGDIKAVFEFQDANKQKISHSIVGLIGHHALAIPMECQYIRLGFKVTGSVISKISGLTSGVIREPVSSLLTKSDTLVLAKQYPAYDDLYKYGFLHSRLRAYKSQSVLVDMFRINNQFPAGEFREFEGIDICTGDKDLLRRTLETGKIKKVLVHLIDEQMWSVLREFKDQLEIFIWVHGAEIRDWQRRSAELESLTKEEITRQKKLSNNRKKFWQNLIDQDLNENIHLIFVSNTFLQESEIDIDRKISRENIHVIHNYIDGNIFLYKEKSPSDRLRILSIRPYTSKNYGNDMTVNMIKELSHYNRFQELHFSIYGDGALFEETVKPIKHFNNVHIYRRFLNHSEISELHQQHGIFVVPTRLDSQGVSRDEAMSSGLVSLTNAVSAVPEFVDKSCSLLVDGEDYKAMAKEVIRMVENPDEFLHLSKAGSQRVAERLNFSETIGKELHLFRGDEC